MYIEIQSASIPPVSFRELLQSWSPPMAVSVSLCLAALIYLRGWLRLRDAFPYLIPASRLAAFQAGISAIWLAIGSPLNALDDVSLTVHMVQHLLLMAIAPPLILLGAPTLPLLQGLPQSVARRIVAPVLRSPLVKSLAHPVTHPVVCWLAATLTLVVWHVPSVFALALRWQWVHDFEHMSFLATGLLFWWPVIQPWPSTAKWPRWSIPLYLLAATLPCDALSGFLSFCDRVVYSSYLSAPRLIDISPLEDQQRAAALMWVSVTLIFLIPAVLVTLNILAPGRARPHETSMSESWRFLREHLHGSKTEAI